MNAGGIRRSWVATKETNELRRHCAIAISVLLAVGLVGCGPTPPAQTRCPYYEVMGTCFTPFEYVTWIDFTRHVQQQDPRITCIRHGESDRGAWPYDDGYQLATGNGYFGAYQYVSSTWDKIARLAGRPDLIGVRPDLAAWWDQDTLALWAVTHGYSSAWHNTRYCAY